MIKAARASNFLLLLIVLLLVITEDGGSTAIAGRIPNPHRFGCGMQTSSKYAYHCRPPSGPIPATMAAALFTDNSVAYVAYSLARTIKEVLYQEPCFCSCNASASHKSLLDCYRNKHASWCHTCQQELLFCVREHARGKSPSQIRQRLFNGGWGEINVQQEAKQLANPGASHSRPPQAYPAAGSVTK
jgi:hypothetical protein